MIRELVKQVAKMGAFFMRMDMFVGELAETLAKNDPAVNELITKYTKEEKDEQNKDKQDSEGKDTKTGKDTPRPSDSDEDNKS